jgi:hypothetical protein
LVSLGLHCNKTAQHRPRSMRFRLYYGLPANFLVFLLGLSRLSRSVASARLSSSSSLREGRRAPDRTEAESDAFPLSPTGCFVPPLRRHLPPIDADPDRLRLSRGSFLLLDPLSFHFSSISVPNSRTLIRRIAPPPPPMEDPSLADCPPPALSIFCNKVWTSGNESRFLLPRASPTIPPDRPIRFHGWLEQFDRRRWHRPRSRRKRLPESPIC